jgi:mRNA interferase MazF
LARLLRGDVVWAELNPRGSRPVVILSQDVFNERSGTVIAVAITSQEPRAAYPLTLEISSVRLPKRSWAKISQIRTLSVRRLGKKLGRLSPEELERIVEGLNEIVGA